MTTGALFLVLATLLPGSVAVKVCSAPFPVTEESRAPYAACLQERCQDTDQSMIGHLECGYSRVLPDGCNTSWSIIAPTINPKWTIADFCPCTCGKPSCKKKCDAFIAEKTYLRPQLTSYDMTDFEKHEISISDPGIASPSNPARIGAYDGDWFKKIKEMGDQPLRADRLKVFLDPHGWEAVADTKVLNYTPVMIYGQPVVPTSKGLAPYSQTSLQGSYWSLPDRPRRMALILLDLQRGYESFVSYTLRAAVPLLKEFRRQGLPVFWTGWIRRPNDGLYGALDRFYGPRGIINGENPSFIYGKDAALPIEYIMPTDEEAKLGRVIKSIHMNKFADVDADGKSILGERLKALGIDTIIIAGAWTELCVLATVFDAVDSRNLDTVVVEDGLASALTTAFKAKEIMNASIASAQGSVELLKYLQTHSGDEKFILPPLSSEVVPTRWPTTLDDTATLLSARSEGIAPNDMMPNTMMVLLMTFSIGIAVGRLSAGHGMHSRGTPLLD